MSLEEDMELLKFKDKEIIKKDKSKKRLESLGKSNNHVRLFRLSLPGTGDQLIYDLFLRSIKDKKERILLGINLYSTKYLSFYVLGTIGYELLLK